MPYPFVLPTTSAFAFSSCINCETHPSLPLNASTYRGVVRDTLKKHKRLPPPAQASNLPLVVSSLTDYLRYLLAIVNSGPGYGGAGAAKDVVVSSKGAPPAIEWRPTLSDGAAVSVPGREPLRVKVTSLEHEVFFALNTLATALSLQGRAALQPLYVTTVAPPGPEQRHAALAGATKLLLGAASIYDYLSSRSSSSSVSVSTASPLPPPPCPDITPSTIAAQRALALAEATLLAVLKDDPYPAVVAQGRNALDRDWMFRAPEIPKVRAHLFARLCLAASEHAAQASSLCQGGGGGAKGGGGSLSSAFVRYIEDLRRTARAKACRFFGIDADLGGKTGEAIGWLRAGLQELGVESREGGGRKGSGSGSGGGGGFAGLGGRLKKEWGEKREDKKVERGASWGADAGRAEETRVIEMLDAKWSKQNDTINTQLVPAPGTLLAQMPSGRDIHTVQPYKPPTLEPSVLEAMRAPPERCDEFGGGGDGSSSEDEDSKDLRSNPIGAFPGTRDEYGRAASSNSYY